MIALCMLLAISFRGVQSGGSIPESIVLTIDTNIADLLATVANPFDYEVGQTFTRDQSEIHDDDGDLLFRTGELIFGYDRYGTRNPRYDTPDTVHEMPFDQTTTAPLVQVMWLDNEDRKYSHMEIRNDGRMYNDARTLSSTMRIDGSVSVGQCAMDYFSEQIYGVRSAVHITFAAYNNESAYIIPPSSYDFDVSYGSGGSFDPFSTTLAANGAPKNVLMGFTLLSNSLGSLMEQTEIEAYLEKMLELICSTISVSQCCSDGSLVSDGSGNFFCSCNPGSIGSCCDKSCVNGHAEGAVCVCLPGFGGPACDTASRAAVFIKDMDMKNGECGGHVTNHHEYLYDGLSDASGYYDYIADGGFDMLDVHSNVVKLGVNGMISGDRRNYGEYNTFNGVEYLSSIENDFIFAVWIEESLGLSSFTIKVEHEGDRNYQYAVAQGDLTRDSCLLSYSALQYYETGSIPTFCEIFFVTGGAGYSILPSGTMLDFTGDPSNDNLRDSFTISGTPSNVIVGYHLISSYNLTDAKGYRIPDGEIQDVVECIMDAVCPLVSIECEQGTKTDIDNVIRCVCDEGWAGESCNYECVHGSTSADNVCECEDGWAGQSCNVRCVHGTVMVVDDNLSCICDARWIGPDCRRPC